MRAVNHDPINWEDPTRDHMTQDVLGPFATYMGKYERNKKKVKFDDDNLSASKNSATIWGKIPLLFSRIRPKSAQVQKHMFFLGIFRAIINQSGLEGDISKPKVIFHLSSDSLSYFNASTDLPA